MRISEELLAKMKSHGEETYPEECCGIFMGLDRNGESVVQDVSEINNSQDLNRRRRFLVTPEQYRESEKLADERGMTLLGFYHSHPDHPAIPSDFDTDHALPWFTYIIVSVAKGRAETVTAWGLREGREKFDERPLVIDVESESQTTRMK